MAQANGSSEQPQTQQASSETSTQDNNNNNNNNSSSNPNTNTSSAPAADTQATIATDPLSAATSLDDLGSGKRPRDARLLHIILSSLGVQAYQERVPLQLMDFAYRYTSGILSDAVHLTAEAYGTAPGNKGAPGNDVSNVTLQSLRLAVASRQHYQFTPALAKEHFVEIAAERNKVGLPPVGKNAAVRLPPERYRLTGVGYSLRGEWDQEVEMGESHGAVPAPVVAAAGQPANGASSADGQMQGVETAADDGESDQDMEDV